MALSSRTAVRPPRPTIDLEVVGTERLSPYLVRVVLGGEGFAAFEDRPETDKYVKLKFTTPSPESLPVTRTYTVRSVDHEARTLAIDFVVHGDEGLAGPWAARARPGDRLSLMGPGGGYAPDATADAHVLAGDLSALPAISAALEALPADAVGHAIIEVDSDAAILPLHAPDGVRIEWAIDPDHAIDALAAVLRQLDWPEGDVQVFAHGERESMKAIRAVLFDERGLDRARVSLSGYWARGRTEDRFQLEKREPIGRIL
ncbi:siderophore-interacting protein [Microbacterium dextranolyticum]|uniref:Siderophore-interacting protein n=1 Tax=Microbacterium dextranolyticum TaxID=36806 RepID=A0A9W6HJX0_9MICO|nr:siderophore-interacting protein [Microbacterium dextranolyticum]MBM7462301.1 NADPH-dependent ferric siderophore reductase [Microbacterium dextranolyticum]GLJ94551.1 siderophore-interacting protein [Microbacterium dextranolyticum]